MTSQQILDYVITLRAVQVWAQVGMHQIKENFTAPNRNTVSLIEMQFETRFVMILSQVGSESNEALQTSLKIIYKHDFDECTRTRELSTKNALKVKSELKRNENFEFFPVYRSNVAPDCVSHNN